MKIPLVDLRAQYAAIRSEIDSAMSAVIADTAFISGKYARRFEEQFAEYCCADHCVGVGNGTDALAIALRAAGIGPGDEVIVPANSFVASSEAVTMAGAKVVFADVDPDTYNLDPDQVAARVTPRTRAVMAVHLYGRPAPLDRLAAVAEEHDLLLVQDCAQAHGASYHGQPIAAYGNVLTFSFYPGKNLGAYGDAGAIVTNDEELATRSRMLANHGRIAKYDHEFEGVNSRLDGLQGAVLEVKLRHLEDWTERRREVAGAYDRLLADIDGLTLPEAAEEARHVYHLYVVRCAERDELRRHLSEAGISAGVHYPVALHNLTAYRYLGHQPDDFPVANRYQDEVLSLPIYPELTDEMVTRVAAEIRSFFDGRVGNAAVGKGVARRESQAVRKETVHVS